jgi:hypothetical protein
MGVPRMPSPKRSARKDKKREQPTSPPEPACHPLIARLAETLLPASKANRWALLGILATALALRIYKLLDLFVPLGDEAIYMRWAEIIDTQGQWFISLIDGKPPLSYWLLAIMRMVNEGDPLLQIRIVSVAVGLASTLCIFALTRKLANGPRADRAGLVAAGLYALFPWAVLYERIGYAECFVNLFGLLIALVSVSIFQRESVSVKDGALLGIVLGLGLFTKQTVILFALIPPAAAVFYSRSQFARRIPVLATCYLIAAAFLVANFVLTPDAPTLAGQDAVLHQTGFFADPAELLSDPFISSRTNIPKILGYLGTYLTWPLALFALAITFVLRGSFAPWLLLSGSLAPLLAQVFALETIFPSRYPFPHFSLWLVVAGLGTIELLARLQTQQKRAVVVLGAIVLAGPLLYRDALMLSTPQTGLHQVDIDGFVADSSFVGYGSLEAVAFLEAQASSGPFILLADPHWGPPSDVFFAYLNGRHGIRVHEAWWLQLDGPRPIMPNGGVDLIRSHYERVPSGQLDFRQAPRVFYATDTHQTSREAVRVRQPTAQLVESFSRPNSPHSIDIYRLR